MSKESDFEFRRWGKEFKDGKLYDFTSNAVVVLSPWPDPRAWVKRKSHGWRCTRLWADRAISDSIRMRNRQDWDDSAALFPAAGNEAGLDEPELDVDADVTALFEETEQDRSWFEWLQRRRRTDRRNIARYMRPVPRNVRKIVRQYSDRNWQIMNLFARCPGIEDLHHSNPALVMALANSWSFQEKPVMRPMRAARGLIHKKQKKIQEWIGFPATEQFRKILAKIPPDSMSLQHLLFLRHWSRDERVLKLLSHIDRINEIVIHMVTGEKRLEMVTPQLLAEVSMISNKHHMREIEQLLFDVSRMQRRIIWRECPQKLLSLARLKAVHDELVERTNRFAPNHSAEHPEFFPDPPFRGTSTIWPIFSPKDLCSEGAEQRNCAASYVESVLNGHEFVYRVYHPYRATLSIARSGEGWIPGQLERAQNRPITGKLRNEIFTQLFASGEYAAPQEEEPEEDREDPQLPLGMTPEVWKIVQSVEETFGRSQSIEIELPDKRISA